MNIHLQPKQGELLELIKTTPASIIGVGGGRGCGKSSGVDRCLIILLSEMQKRSLNACLMMRNYDQVYKYHIETIRRDFPELLDAKGVELKQSMPASLTIGRSKLDFSYAEDINDVIRRFQGGNYGLVVIDQAEQFSWKEISEIRRATRMRGGEQATIVLLFNMRGAFIHELRDRFYLWKKEDADPDDPSYNPEDFIFLKFNPWDNVTWVEAALKEDGYTPEEYDRWTDEQRKRYAAERGPYTRQLANDDPAISKADWEGDWDAIQGTYFQNSYDQRETEIHPDRVASLMKPWANYWMGQDWGEGHYCVTYWCFRVGLSPAEAKQLLGWRDLQQMINVTVVYRELVGNGLTPDQMAREMVFRTPEEERPRIRNYFLSPEAVTDKPYSVGHQQGLVLRMHGLPGPVKADNDRVGGWSLMSSLLRGTKFHGREPIGDEAGERGGHFTDVLLISSACTVLLESIPKLVRDPKRLEDVLKTDINQARVEQDSADAIRYALKSMLNPKKKSADDVYREEMARATPAEQTMMTAIKFLKETNARPRSYWGQRMKQRHSK